MKILEVGTFRRSLCQESGPFMNWINGHIKEFPGASLLLFQFPPQWESCSPLTKKGVLSGPWSSQRLDLELNQFQNFEKQVSQCGAFCFLQPKWAKGAAQVESNGQTFRSHFLSHAVCIHSLSISTSLFPKTSKIHSQRPALAFSGLMYISA